MDRLGHAEAILAAARARSVSVVCPGYAPSPMDADSTLTVPRGLIADCDIAVGAIVAGEIAAAGPHDPLDAEMLRAARGRGPASRPSRTA